MKYIVVNREQDLAGKYRIWVEINPEETIMLKFESEVSDVVIESEVDRILFAREQEMIAREVSSGIANIE
jgi:hypothetical protein